MMTLYHYMMVLCYYDTFHHVKSKKKELFMLNLLMKVSLKHEYVHFKNKQITSSILGVFDDAWIYI